MGETRCPVELHSYANILLPRRSSVAANLYSEKDAMILRYDCYLNGEANVPRTREFWWHSSTAVVDVRHLFAGLLCLQIRIAWDDSEQGMAFTLTFVAFVVCSPLPSLAFPLVLSYFIGGGGSVHQEGSPMSPAPVGWWISNVAGQHVNV